MPDKRGKYAFLCTLILGCCSLLLMYISAVCMCAFVCVYVCVYACMRALVCVCMWLCICMYV